MIKPSKSLSLVAIRSLVARWGLGACLGWPPTLPWRRAREAAAEA